MKNLAFNPYLPSYEYIPDGEPHVFGDRIYIYGSHDQFKGADFCLNDYACWSAPVTDLSDWKYEGIIYQRSQDPMNQNMKQYLYAPDVCQGTDGKYYLFYALHMSTSISVAVCDTPCGKFQFLGHVHTTEGVTYGTQAGEINCFDPGVLVDDDGRIYLYMGFSPEKGFMRKMMEMRKRNLDGGFVVELEPDMLTMKGEPKLIAPGPLLADGTGFAGHAFFEASSMRKVNGKYYFIYSSVLSHELCYAVGDSPVGPFTYQGTIISTGDVGLHGVTIDAPMNTIANTHGSMEEINGKWYVFYHRHTDLIQSSRQGCAEEIAIDENGQIAQVEMTSCGLNGGPLPGTGSYEARIACNLVGKDGVLRYERKRIKKPTAPYFTQTGEDREDNPDQYVANMTDGSWAGYKYFDFNQENEIKVEAKGKGSGCFEIRNTRDGEIIGAVSYDASQTWKEYTGAFTPNTGKQAIYITYRGTGSVDMKTITFQ